MKEGPGNGREMTDMMKEEQVFLTPGKKRTKVRLRQEVEDIHDRQTLQKLASLLKELTRNKFFGELLIKYESGHVVYIRKTQSIKLLEKCAG